MYSLRFLEKEIDRSGFIGGNIKYDESISFDFPTGMIPFITLETTFFPTDILKEDEMISVFIDENLFFGTSKNDFIIDLTMNNSEQENNPNLYKIFKFKKGTTALLKKDQNILPEISISLKDFTDEEMREELKDEDCGARLSKAFGRLGYLQDDVSFGMKFKFLLQIFENDLAKINSFYNGIFNNGSLYFFLNKNAKKINYGEDIGKLFIQFQ